MALEPGTRLGPYEVTGPLGAGGMGEVYRARDTRLPREVAVKVLPDELAGDPERRRRFEDEARAVATLSDPHIVTLLDVGHEDGSSYLVMELLEGETLRASLRGGALRPRRAAAIAADVAAALAAAHSKGILHRDLKPENVFITRDGHAKVLDFGLAKLAASETPGTHSPTATRPGQVFGTYAYMSPEQARGKELDARSDIFSFGALLYEMVAGRRAFSGDSWADIASAIIKEDPPELETTPAGLARVVRHCLEKEPERRFQSARDLLFAVQDAEAATSGSSLAKGSMDLPSRRAWLKVATAAGLGAIAGGAAGFAIGRRGPPETPWFSKRLTFRHGAVLAARFSAQASHVLYSASWDGAPSRLFRTSLDSPTEELLDKAGDRVQLAAVSVRDDLSLLGGSNLGPRGAAFALSSLTLASMPMAGGTPKALLEGVISADWSPDGETQVVSIAQFLPPAGSTTGFRIRLLSGPDLLTAAPPAFATNLRFSPDGRRVAFLRWGLPSGTELCTTDLTGKTEVLFSGGAGPGQQWGDLAWAKGGGEIWFTAPDGQSGLPVIFGVPSAGGAPRDLVRGGRGLLLMDVRGDRVVLARRTTRRGVLVRAPGSTVERDLAYLDGSQLSDISADGHWIAFDEVGEGKGSQGKVFFRRTDGSPPVQVPGLRFALALSADGRMLAGSDDKGVVVVPTGPGEARRVETPGFTTTWAWFLPDGSGLLLYGTEAGRSGRFGVHRFEGGGLRMVTPENVLGSSVAFSPDGRFIAVTRFDWYDRALSAYPLGEGEVRPLPRLLPGEAPIQWTADGRRLYVARLRVPVDVYLVDCASGARSLWRTLSPADPAGVAGLSDLFLTRDGSAYAYHFVRFLDELHVVDGLG